MKISVVTVCYNAASTLAGAIESFLQQDYSDKELLIIDGGSFDGTVEVARSYACSQISVLSEPDRGIYDAMNKGLRLFRGDVVGFLNSDDVYHDATVLSRLGNALDDADMAYGDLQIVESHEKKKVIRSWRAGKYSPWSYQLGWMPPHPTFYVRRKVVEELRQFDLSYSLAADYDFMLRAMANRVFKIAYVPHMLVDFKMGGTSTNGWKQTFRINLECLRSRRAHLSSPTIDVALVLRPLRRLFQLRDFGRYLFR
jgi:glycosyltransferase